MGHGRVTFCLAHSSSSGRYGGFMAISGGSLPFTTFSAVWKREGDIFQQNLSSYKNRLEGDCAAWCQHLIRTIVREIMRFSVCCRLYFKSTGKKVYKGKAWYEFPLAGNKLPLEPILKVLFTFIGINAELWAGHVSYRYVQPFSMRKARFSSGNTFQNFLLFERVIVTGLTLSICLAAGLQQFVL